MSSDSTDTIHGLSAKAVSDENVPVFRPITSKPALQKAETEWKTDIQIPCAPNCRIKAGIMASAPISSTMKVTRNRKNVSLTTPPICCVEIVSCSILR